MAHRSIIHPNVVEAIGPQFYPSLITIQLRGEGINNVGDPITTWTDIPEFLELDCQISFKGIREADRGDGVRIADQAISIKGYYPDIEPTTMRAVDEDEHIYDIITVGWDSAKLTTHLDCSSVVEE